ncbi:endonuclease/exonuclease/phosphatase family protein [Neptuniibacter sp. QD72_48]|uniref:endonuclease/exonuclease/phosphatase family protein n=1 Tax=unclassified Neptuniibacter TaxID=2630693 RepID=UPI0039F57A87
MKSVIKLLGLALFSQAFPVQADNHKLSILTWNVWFDDRSGQRRYPLILDEIYQQNADIVALQEVTPKFIGLLEKHRLNERYHVSFSSQISRYQNVTLTKVQPQYHEVINLTSAMGRKALMVHLKTSDNCDVVVANLHLESPLDSSELRVEQIQKVVEALPSDHLAILAGDFNFGNKAIEENATLHSFYDAANSDEWINTPTYDVELNLWAQQTKFWFEDSRRLDRVYLNTPNALEQKYTLVAQLRLEKAPFLSDHYGVKFSFGLNEAQIDKFCRK